MSSIRLALCAAAAACVAVSSLRAQIAPSYTLTDVGLGDYSLNTPGSPSINNAGQIVLGFATQPARVWQNGVFTNLGGPATTRAMYINNLGHVVGGDGPSLNPIGWFAGAGGGFTPFIGANNEVQGINDHDDVVVYPYSTGGGTVYHASTGTSTPTNLRGAYGINNAGVVVGDAMTERAATSVNGVVTLLPGNLTQSRAVSINDAGVAVGFYFPSGGLEFSIPVRWNANGTVDQLPLIDGFNPNSARFIASSINESGLIVGYLLGQGRTGLAWYGNSVVNLNTRLTGAPGWTLLAATDVNASGQIVGIATFAGQDHVVLLNPTPTPGAAVLLGLGGVVGLRRQRR